MNKISVAGGVQLFFIGWCAVSALLGDSADQQLLEVANHAYRSGDYAQAVQEYLAIAQPSAAVLYNLGNSYYRLGNFGKAMVNWRKAEAQWPLFTSRRDLLDNILLAQHEHGLVAAHATSGVLYAQRYAISLLQTIPLLVLQMLFLGVWLFLFWQLRVLYKRRQRWLVVLLAACVAVLGLMLMVRYVYARRGIVTAPQANMLSGPGDYRVMSVLLEGQEVVIKTSLGGYYKIRCGGKLGWVPKDAIEEI